MKSLIIIFLFTLSLQQDPNFYIFLAFGQSNMEGQGPIEDQDRQCNPRFQMMAPVDMPVSHRTENNWYTATPPLVRDGTRLSPSDYFGRQLVNKLPKNIRVGIINISIGGTSIDLYDEDKVEDYLKTCWVYIRETAEKYYHNNPFRHLVNKAKEAQKFGVIKGILLHQGEADNGKQSWPNSVKTVYTRLLAELGLKQSEVPLLAGEVVRTEMGGECGGHNKIIAMLPSVIENAHVISAEGLPGQDSLHFTGESYRIFGRRYGDKMYELLSKNMKINRVKFMNFPWMNKKIFKE